jgi:NADPH:quinone reductase
MKIVQINRFGGPEVLRVQDAPRPSPRPGMLLIRVTAAGLNHADVIIRGGRHVIKPVLPWVPGFEVAGTVAAIGAGVDERQFPSGARVAALTLGGGGYAEYVVARAAHSVVLPDALTIEQGAALLFQGLTAYHTLVTMGRLEHGETVAVQAAAGGVGTMLVQLARLLGAGRVIAIAGGPEKMRLASKLGADDAVDYLRENFPARVNEITGGRGADLILESVGGQTLERSFDCLATLGRVVTFGTAGGSQADLNAIVAKLRSRSQSLIGFSLRSVLDDPRARERSIACLLQFVAGGRLNIVVGRRYHLDQAAAAQEALETRRTTGKILLSVDHGDGDAGAVRAGPGVRRQ